LFYLLAAPYRRSLSSQKMMKQKRFSRTFLRKEKNEQKAPEKSLLQNA